MAPSPSFQCNAKSENKFHSVILLVQSEEGRQHSTESALKQHNNKLKLYSFRFTRTPINMTSGGNVHQNISSMLIIFYTRGFHIPFLLRNREGNYFYGRWRSTWGNLTDSLTIFTLGVVVGDCQPPKLLYLPLCQFQST